MSHWIGAAGTLLFVVVMLLDGLTRPGYSPTRHTVSALSLGSRGWLQTLNFIVCGAAVLVGANGILAANQSLPLAIVLGVFGAALIASGLFRMDPMRGYPAGTSDTDPEEFSSHHRIHDQAGAVVFLALPIAAVIVAFEVGNVGWIVVHALIALALAIAAGAFGIAWEKDSPSTGLIQRAYIVPGWIWVAALFLALAS